MNWFQNDLYGNKISFFCYHESKYREIFGDGINSFQDEHLRTLGKKCFYKCLIIIIIIIIITIITIIIIIDIVNFQFQVQNGDENVHLLKIDTSKAFEKFSGKYLDSTDSGEEMFREFHSSLTHSFHPV